MSDRKLLEQAAKAAGIEFADPSPIPGDGRFWLKDGLRYLSWNPLHDDGDALRLVVRLRLELTVEPDEVWAGLYTGEFTDSLITGDDPAAATRRAIVRAAASIAAIREQPMEAL